MDTVTVMVFLLIGGVAASTTHHKLCYKDHPILDGLICYKKCAPGYSHYGGGPLCWAICPPRTRDIGAVCVKFAYGRGIGTALSTCISTHERVGFLCYHKCRSGYYGVGPMCWSSCPGGYHDDGFLCRRDAHAYWRNVNSCPWWNKCGYGRNCGHRCPPSYGKNGCMCFRGAHIFVKSSYGRGGASGMGCKWNEQKAGSLCYPHCVSGYYGVGPICWAFCAGLTVDTGTQCQKKFYGRGVGKPVNCLNPPSLSDITNYTGLVEMFKKAEDLETLQAIGCSTLYIGVKFWIILARTFSNCHGKEQWQTVSVSYSAGADAGATVSGEVGVAASAVTKKAICYVGYCYGLKIDYGIGADIGIGIWRSLSDIPGESVVAALTIEIPFADATAFTAVFIVNTDSEFIGTQLLYGIGVGTMPYTIGVTKCNTPEESVIPVDI